MAPPASHDQMDAVLLRDWCVRWLGAERARVLFRKGHLSAVIGLELRTHQHVVVKTRPADARVAGCVAVQRHLFARGFPCPRPIAGPGAFGHDVATAEALVWE